MKPKRCHCDLTMWGLNFKLTGGSNCSVTACASYFIRNKGRNLCYNSFRTCFTCFALLNDLRSCLCVTTSHFVLQDKTEKFVIQIRLGFDLIFKSNYIWIWCASKCKYSQPNRHHFKTVVKWFSINWYWNTQWK